MGYLEAISTIKAIFPRVCADCTTLPNSATIIDLPIASDDLKLQGKILNTARLQVGNFRGNSFSCARDDIEFLLVRASPRLRAVGVQWIRVEYLSLLSDSWDQNGKYVGKESPWDILWMQHEGEEVGYVVMVTCGDGVGNKWKKVCEDMEKRCP